MKSPLVLAVIGILLGIGTTAGVIFMNKDKIFAPVAEKKSAKLGDELPTPSNAPREWTLRSQEISALAQALRDERAALDVRKKELDEEAAQVAIDRKELLKTRAEIDAMRKEVVEKIPTIETAEKQNVKTLAKTYAAMSPTAAVAVLREMDDQNIVKILSLMKADIVGALFQEMARTKDETGTLAARAAHISDQLRLLHSNSDPTAAQP